MSDAKNILVLASRDKPEALRMAAGLTLLDDTVRVAVLGSLDRADAEVEMQLEALDFADVHVATMDVPLAFVKHLGDLLADADTVLLA